MTKKKIGLNEKTYPAIVNAWARGMSDEKSQEFVGKTQELDDAYEKLESIVKKEVRKPLDEIVLSLVGRIVELNVELDKDWDNR